MNDELLHPFAAAMAPYIELNNRLEAALYGQSRLMDERDHWKQRYEECELINTELNKLLSKTIAKYEETITHLRAMKGQP